MKTTIVQYAAISLICFLPHIVFTQNVGIGTSTPIEKLHVAGNILTDTAKVNALQLAPNAGIGKILTSDDVGNATWEELTSPPENNSPDNIGYGVWGDCATNAILSEYNPVANTGEGTFAYFGFSVSIDGNFAIVGAPDDSGVSGTSQGSASIYQYDGNEWVLMEKLFDTDGATYDEFGYSVSISGDFVMIGALGDNGPAGADQGSVSTYRYDGTSWVFIEKLLNTDPAANDFFGYSVSISGTYAIVGATGDEVNIMNQGSASIYEFDGSNWVFIQKITDPAGISDAAFGYSVFLSGNYAIVGSPNDDLGAGINQGSACIYGHDGSNWVFMQKITDATGDSYDYFGNSVCISGNYAIVGSYADDVSNIQQGSANIYKYNGIVWALMQKITDPLGSAYDHFGHSVSISGNYVVVSANDDKIGANVEQGSASIFMRLENYWNKLVHITDPAGNTYDSFGNATAVDGLSKRFIIGISYYANYKGKAIFGKID